MLHIGGWLGRARRRPPWVLAVTASLHSGAGVHIPKPLEQLQRLQSMVREVSATNSPAKKKGILSKYQDVAPILERYVLC